MGVAGSGKSTLGAALAHDLGWEFIESDRYHPPANIAKMAAGQPLTDQDRWPWLDRLRGVIQDRLATGQPAVLACSALREAYRQRLRTGFEPQVPTVFLKGDHDTIRQRLSARRGHYLGPQLLESQFQTLEEPADAIVIPIEVPLEAAVRDIRQALAL
jgi:gluconokinase